MGTPEDFCQQLENKAFTSKKADFATVGQLYRDGFEERLATKKHLYFNGLGWGDDEAKTLARVLASGSLAKLQALILHDNHIGDDGILALANALAGGACPRLGGIKVYRGNPASAKAKKSFEVAVKQNVQRFELFDYSKFKD